MRLTGYEIKKLMTQIPLWIAFIGLFVGNLFLLFMIQKKEAAYVYVYQQKDQYIAFCEGNEQADELGFYEADLEEQKRYLDSYREFISQMQDRSKAMENVISEGNHYLTDNIRKTCHDFSAVAKASVTVDNCFGIKALAEYQYGIFFAISFQGVLTWYLLFYERNRKLFILIKGCKNGHHVTAYSKLFLLLSGGVLYTLLQETSVVLFLKWMYGYGNMNRPVQSVSLFRNCPYVLSVGQAIGLLIFLRVGLSLLTGSVLFMAGMLVKSETGAFIVMMLPMICFTTAANGIFAALIIAAFKLTSHGVTDEFVLNLFFYVIITSILTVTLMKIAYAGESQLLVDDAVNRMYSILETEPLAETKSGETPKDSSIQLDNAVFAYDNAESNAVDGITMNIKAGEHIAVVGPSGGGKTTLCSLIARFWDVKSGSIKIGGADVRNIPSEELMKYVSYVFQDSKLLKMSILDNVRMGRPDATDEEVMTALRDAQCMDIIEKFPEGVDTMIGSKGIYVSGGECQRLSIARAFLKNAPVLILDEATAFADPDNERSVQQAFERLSKDKTVIMIAHRLSTVTNADRIYVLSEGRIAESGKHEELIEQGGIYSRMWNEYNRSVSWQVRKAGV